MCLAVPSKIIHIENDMATIDVEGIHRQVSVLLLEDAQVGDYVIVHAGFAIQRIDEAAAAETLDLLRQAMGLIPPEDEANGSGGASEA
jgi:hydrogenase expression/formation protein HypC